MKKILLAIILVASFVPAANAACNIRGTTDNDDKVYYTPEHRLYKHVKVDVKTFCSVSEAESAGYDAAPKYFADSTHNMVECVEDGSSECTNYLLGIHKSLAIYEETCGANNAGSGEVISKYLENAKKDKYQDIDKYSGIVAALKDAYPCGRRSKKS